MKQTIGETIRPNGIKVQLGQHGSTFIVKDFYKDGSQRDVKFFGSYNSAVTCFNNIVEKENAGGE
jgi:hypothetical protein